MKIFGEQFHRWGGVLLMTAAVKAALFLFVAVAHGGAGSTLIRWLYWDGLNYLSIAERGYDAHSIVWYPLYPLLIRGIAAVMGSVVLAPIVISVFFSCAASVALYELVRLDFDHRVARKTVWFLNIFPTAYFLQAAYPESLFLFLSLLTVYWARRRAGWAGGFAGGLAALTRPAGMFLVPLLLMETAGWKRILCLSLLLLGIAGYLGVNFFYFGDPFFFLHEYAAYENVAGIEGGSGAVEAGARYLAVEFLFLAGVAVAGWIAYRTIRKSYGIYMWVTLAGFLASVALSGAFRSMPRYALVLFPIFILFGKIQNGVLHVALSAVSIAALLYLTYLFTGYRWAF